MDLINTTKAKNKKLHDEYVQTMIDYKHSWEEEILRCKLIGITLPEPIPHPDHIKIDLSTGQVRITGPFTREKKRKMGPFSKNEISCEKNYQSF